MHRSLDPLIGNLVMLDRARLSGTSPSIANGYAVLVGRLRHILDQCDLAGAVEQHQTDRAALPPSFGKTTSALSLLTHSRDHEAGPQS